MTEENPVATPEVPQDQTAPAQADAATAATDAVTPEAAAPEAQAAPASAPAQQQPQQRGRGGHGGGHGGGRDGRGRGQRDRRDRREEEGGLESSVVKIDRVSKVVKGGRTFSFGALVIAGDRQGNVGIGYGKANEVPMAVEKATKDARKNMVKVSLKGSTIPHVVKGRFGASSVVLAPARPGTGVTAGKSVRPVLELSGITDILTKAYGSTNPKNLVKATVAALQLLQSAEQAGSHRGVELPKGAGELQTA